MDGHGGLRRGNQVTLVIGDDGDGVSAWRQRQTLRVRDRSPPHGLGTAGPRHSQRHPVNVPDDLAEAAALVCEQELHLDLTLGCGEVRSGLHNGDLGRQAGREDGVNIDLSPLLLQELGRIAL
jgi:hypothetical protein